MKKLASVLLSSALVVSMAAISASAAVEELPADWDPTAYEYIVVGNEGILGSYAWQPTNEAFKMNYDEAANVWYLNLEGVANEGETFDVYNAPQYKVAVFGYDEADPWAFSFNETGVAYGLDSNSYVDFGEVAETADVVTITFDGYKTQSTIDNPYVPAGNPTEEHTYFAVGNENLFDPAWTPNCPDYQLTKGADGIYSVTIPVTEDQWDVDVAYKVAQDGSWDVSYNDQGLAEGLNSDATLYIPEGTVSVVITFNPETLCAGAECVMAGEEPTEAPTAEATEAPTAEATEAPTAEATEAPTAEATEATEASTDEATVAPTQAPTNATNATDATKATEKATTTTTTTTTTTNSSATGKVATGDSTSVALLIGMLMLAGAGVVVARKRIAE